MQLVPAALLRQIRGPVVVLVVVVRYAVGQHPLAPGALQTTPKLPVGLVIFGDQVVGDVVSVVVILGAFTPRAVKLVPAAFVHRLVR